MVLGCTYMLYLYRRVVFGKLTRDDLKTMLDLDRREIAIFAPLVVLVLWMGIYPSSFLDPMALPVGQLVDRLKLAEAAGHAIFLAQH